MNDGSTDRTEEIARRYDAVTVLGFDRNRGYGAAIKSGFAAARGDWVGFLDADGTCEPAFFANLCRALDAQHADVALGSRMGPGSEMPLVRTIGNTVFALILGVLSRQRIGDTASGMRVLRKAVLPDLDPMPDGLHYTPAMTARVLLEGKLVLIEEPMPYAERIGDSKLSVARDGVRFLVSIVRAAAIYRPARPLLLFAALFALGALLLGSGPSLLLAAPPLARGVDDLPRARGAAARHRRRRSSRRRRSWRSRSRRSRTGARPRAAASRASSRASSVAARRSLRARCCFAVAVAVSWPGIVEYVDDRARADALVARGAVVAAHRRRAHARRRRSSSPRRST